MSSAERISDPLAAAQIVNSLFVSGAAFRPFGETRKGFFLIGNGGLYIPRLTMAGQEVSPERFTLALYYVIVAAFVGSLLLLRRVVRSPFGLALAAIRDSETRAVCVGVPVRWHRWRAFVISATFTGLAGGLVGQLNRQVTPQQLDWLTSAQLVVASVLGGTRRFYGPVAGAFAVVALNEVALRFALYHGLVLGMMLVAAVLVFPEGLAGTSARFLARWQRRRQ
jgi:branched-chain amino acid transport system permease protein